ncbi:MAG: 2-hydroxyacyl-CoA dehydratase [Vicinamibacterales bacterium]|jgi:benzoyl-CoA reductase subunit C|nr:hypothetical protein [Acidobacteriota bacterium]MDP7478792.1 2-hydroxyacyl-CoA dehydratase [Vicinamibacterales bacterium]MDP7670365.1 2-hydroxyacyl-CoA dehydratase [Vicinamibacterales bacterium]HJO38022.1 2-hydroxyacyl-CoA dehydratase [Vicinamibacterales bacterium]|tara:strand:+ start:4037 stop:5209 length:1173 start_codon:yes stop_codon:yes gene_type:complete
MVTRTLDVPVAGRLEDLTHFARDLLDDTDFPTVRRWRDAGGKVVGHFQVYFPEELAHAAGLLPVKIRGAQLEARQAEARFGSYLCSILKSSLELALSGRIELDMFVTHPICDAARNLAAVWGRNFPYSCQILYLPQNADSPHAASYLQGEYVRLQHDLEEIAGRAVTAADVARSIGVFNENRRLLRQLYAVKRDRPWLVSVSEAYVLMAIGGIVPREEHNDLLQRALELIEQRDAKPQDRMRVVFEGGFCEQPPTDLLHMIGQFTYVVDDDLLIGMRWLLDDVPTDADTDPWMNLAVAYLECSSYSPVQHDLRKPKERMLLDRIRGADAQAAIISAAKMCEPGLDEQVAYAKALEADGIPYFVTEFEEGMTSFDHLQIQLETFVENVLFA